MTHIPFKGGGPALTALMSGEVDAMLVPGSFGFPFISAGKVRPLAVTESGRLAKIPDLPSFEEEGFHGIAGGWSALFAPRDTPREIVAKLNGEATKALKTEELQNFYIGQFLVPLGGPPEAVAEQLHGDIVRWRDLVRKIGVVPQ